MLEGVSKWPVIMMVTSPDLNGELFLQSHARLRERGMRPYVVTTDDIPAGFDLSSEQNKIKAYLNSLPSGTNLPKAIAQSNLPIIREIMAHLRTQLYFCDGIWLCGGEDIWAKWYSNNENSPADFWRDIIEIIILHLQENEMQKPLIGICRGCQMINVFRGGSLKNSGEYHINSIIIEKPDGMLGSSLVACVEAWSAHHQSIDRVGENLEVVAKSQKSPQIVEAIQDSTQLPLFGTQFHPETEQVVTTCHAILNRYSQLVKASALLTSTATNEQTVSRLRCHL